MVMAMSDWFSGLATPTGIGYFTTGFIAAFVVRAVYCRMKRQPLHLPWRAIGIALGVSAIVVVSLQSSQAYNTAKRTALEVQDCQRQLFAAITSRARIAAENDEQSQAQRLIVYNWFHDLIVPPQPYASMDTDDPRRQQYGLALTVATEREFQKSLNRQDELQRQRDAHKLPDPTCGK
jgi:hypothetical protein